jgi:hypothetical protein
MLEENFSFEVIFVYVKSPAQKLWSCSPFLENPKWVSWSDVTSGHFALPYAMKL